MCETCGCGEPGNDHTHDHDHEHKHKHKHDHKHKHNHHDHDHSHEPASSGRKILDVNKDVLHENNLMAARNRGFFEGRNIFCLNLVSSPGSGKTTILEKTMLALKPELRMMAIEGDQQTSLDAERIMATGVPVVQINTGMGCHLDARMVNRAMTDLPTAEHSILFIENVGNLVCPAMFDLGESKRVLIISVTEGDDKPLKYPAMFRSAHLCIINKTDLLPYVIFDVEKVIQNAKSVNPELEFIQLSAITGEGMGDWLEWCRRSVK
ncbi:MAG: hydrogenase nickel incorporation protein HypB [Bacteroidetes bacterium]|nr:hydrogenase nickel incorporation protein HypB [Bacteroidota bacterium]